MKTNSEIIGLNSTCPPIRLSDPTVEWTSGWIHAEYHIKVGIPRDYLPFLRAFGKKIGAKKAPVATAARLFVLLGSLSPKKMEAMFGKAKKKKGDLNKAISYFSDYKTSCDPADN